MSHRISNIFLMMLAVVFSACQDNMPQFETVANDPGTITIHLRNSRMSRSEASDNSENKIDNLRLYFYASATEENAEPIYYTTYTFPTDTYNDGTIALRLSYDLVNTLFNNTSGNKCYLYVIANLDAAMVSGSNGLNDKSTIAEIKSLSIRSAFNTLRLQSKFVMTGGCDVTYTADADKSWERGKASGTVNLLRAAAKIRMNLRLPAQIEHKVTNDDVTSTEVWEPVKELDGVGSDAESQIRLLLNNGVRQSIARPVDWEPSGDDASSYYYDSKITNNRDTYRTLKDSGEDYSETTTETNDDGTIETKTTTWDVFEMAVPYYTYPNRWTENEYQTRKTTMTLIIPWRKVSVDGVAVANNEVVYYYYQVPVTPSYRDSEDNLIGRIDPNYSYTLNLKVGMLGSLTADDPIDLHDLTYQVVDWANEEVEVNIQDTRYLMVSPKEITVNNEASFSVQYYSSHPVEVTDVKIEYQRFAFCNIAGNSDNGEVVTFTIDQDVIDESNKMAAESDFAQRILTVVREQNQLNITHPLNLWTPYHEGGGADEVVKIDDNGVVSQTGYDNADTSTVESVQKAIDYYLPTEEAAFSSYTIKLTIRHIDRPDDFSETVTITQYPAMYIKPERNPGGIYRLNINSDTAAPQEKDWGNVFVNASYINTNGGYWNCVSFGRVSNIENEGNNKNPCMYVVTLSQLDKSYEDYVIADPRMTVINNQLSGTENLDNVEDKNSTWTPSAQVCNPAIYLYPVHTNTNATRTLSYYYPTQETEETRMMIAPKLRVASSYGEMTARATRQQCRRRCATYQECGYPAGRWRVPTYAEMKFFVSLAGSGKIPQLFNIRDDDHKKSVYMTAQGPYYVKADGSGDLVEYDSTNDDIETGITSFYVRPVYDEWYWGDDVLTTDNNGNYTYTFGDAER